MGKTEATRASHREKPRKTRTLILETARELFNEQGISKVTLAHIGEHLGISEGNVWYHFHTKQDLVLALFTELQMRVATNVQRNIEDLGQFQRFDGLLERSFRTTWEYRFLFRDHISWAVSQPEIHEKLIAITSNGRFLIEEVLKRMVQLHYLEIPPRDIPRLAISVWIINRYWLDYCQSRTPQQQLIESDIREGIEQVRFLFLPYLTSSAPGGLV
ncbi:MAG TPA: TetR/AcrR family transcriptional regulator [Ktedonobacteraceae bacterium]|nr:TetR/AcrR family transcriptional regulator [Ktedonobacteraceae bacterium]